MVQKALSTWRPVIDLSHLNELVQQTRFKMESNQLVLQSVQMVFIDLKDAYLQVLIHPGSRKFLRFVVDGTVYQFQALCFGLSTAPQVFTRVMTLVSVMLHSLGVRMLRYLDDWLILASSRSEALQAKGQSVRIVSDSLHCCKPGEVLSCTAPDSDLSRYGSGQSLFEGFSHREASVNLTRANCRISLLQEAKRHLLVMSSESACLS